MKMMVVLSAAMVAGIASAENLKVERLEGDLFRVRMTRGEKWPESGMNRYGILKELPVLSVRDEDVADGWVQATRTSLLRLGTSDGDVASPTGTSDEDVASPTGTSDGDVASPTGTSGEDVASTGKLPVAFEAKQVGKGFELRFPLKPDTRVFGLGDVCRTNVNRRGSSFQMWVKNVTSYIPVPVAFTSEGWGVFVNTTWRHAFDVGKTDKDALVVTAPEGEVDFYLFAGKDMRALLKSYTGLTGRPAMLPAWGYGFTYVCNDNVNEFKVLDEAEHFRTSGFPCDVIGIEPEWMKTYYDKSLKKDWDPDRYHFPEWAPNGASGTWGATEPTIWPQALAGMGFKLSLWLCCDYDLFRYEEQCAAGLARKAGRQPDLAAGIAEFWQDDRITGGKKSGDKRYRPELEVEEGKLPWFEHLKKFVDQGARCFKLDGAWQVTEHPDRAWANGMTDEQAHNLYPLVYAKQMARGYEDYVNKRSMVYSSGGWAGIQQFIASWAGDTGGGVKPLGSILNLGMSGHSNHSCDMQIGDPKSRHFGFLQAWSQQNNWYYWKQAWYMSPEKQASFREYGKLRYSLLPYLYGAAAEASRTGWPVVRSLALEYPGTAAYDQTITTYKLGDALLVSAFAPETEIPAGEWFDWWTGARVQGPAKRAETVTEAHGGGLYVKAGAIIPTWPAKTHVDKGWNEEVVFEVWPSADGTAELYEDDGESLEYRSGACARTPLAVARDASGRITFTVGRREGAFKGMPATRRMKVRLHFEGHVEEGDLGDVGADGAKYVWEGRRQEKRVELDRSPDRVKTPLAVDMKRIGTLAPRSVAEITSSNWTLGCETLDRDYADFSKYRRFLAPLGIKTIRLQAGWAKCEREKGKFDFAWLDEIVDYARSQGINVLMEFSYGNPIYKGGGGRDLAGGFPEGEEGLAAWDRWVDALSRHFKGRVRDWAMWNEPDNAGVNSPEVIADFNVRTAKGVLKNVPDARLAGLSLATSNPEFFGKCLDALGEDAKLFTWFVYHGYAIAPEKSYAKVEALKAELAKRVPTARMRQGENGCPSDYSKRFALWGQPWTEYSQAKWDMRRMLGDLGHDVESAVFTICDFNHIGRQINTKGLLRANRSHDVIAVKRAYYAVQNVVSVFDGRLARVKEPALEEGDESLEFYEYRDPQDRPLYVFWQSASELTLQDQDRGRLMKDWHPFDRVYQRPGDSFETRPVSFMMPKTAALKDPVWVDLLTGRVYEVPAESVLSHADGVTYIDIPVYDSPCVLTDRAALEIQAL